MTTSTACNTIQHTGQSAVQVIASLKPWSRCGSHGGEQHSKHSKHASRRRQTGCLMEEAGEEARCWEAQRAVSASHPVVHSTAIPAPHQPSFAGCIHPERFFERDCSGAHADALESCCGQRALDQADLDQWKYRATRSSESAVEAARARESEYQNTNSPTNEQ